MDSISSKRSSWFTGRDGTAGHRHFGVPSRLPFPRVPLAGHPAQFDTYGRAAYHRPAVPVAHPATAHAAAGEEPLPVAGVPSSPRPAGIEVGQVAVPPGAAVNRKGGHLAAGDADTQWCMGVGADTAFSSERGSPPSPRSPRGWATAGSEFRRPRSLMPGSSHRDQPRATRLPKNVTTTPYTAHSGHGTSSGSPAGRCRPPGEWP
jgi:hypothetical protein